MAITAIKDFKIKEAYTRLVEKALYSYLWEGIYKPMFEILNIKPIVAKNSLNVITEALRDEKITYYDGIFRAKGKFTNAQSVQLQKWGAVWDRREKGYRLPEDRLPDELRVTIAEMRINAENQIKLLQGYIQQVEANMPYIVESMVFDNEIKTILDDAGNEVKKNIRTLNIIEPELSEQQKDEIAKAYTNNMRDYVIKDFANERIPEMRAKIQELVLQGYRQDKIQELLQKEYGFMARKAKFLAQNETTIMLAEYKKVTYKEMGFDKFIWRTITDGRERELHKALNGTVWRYDDPPVIDERTGQRGLPGQTYNCLIGEMNILSPYFHHRIFKRKFRGKLTELVLPMGTLKVTPNHPILTDKGWVAAKCIQIGDKVAKISDKTFLRAGTNPNNVKITIEEFFSFYSVLFQSERVSHSNLDFHSDISIDNQVDIINIKSKLGDYFNADFTQSRLKQLLTKTDEFVISDTRNRAFYQAFPFGFSSSDSFICCLSKIFSFFFSNEFHSVKHSFRAIAWLDTLLDEVIGYNTSTNPEFFTNLFNTQTTNIKLYQLIIWDIFFNCFRKNIIPSLLHGDREVSSATAETLSNIFQTQPTFIEFDTVIDKIVRKSSFTHIYNLENNNNWYLTENYITKNCRCEQIPYHDDSVFEHDIRNKKEYQQLISKNNLTPKQRELETRRRRWIYRELPLSFEEIFGSDKEIEDDW